MRALGIVIVVVLAACGSEYHGRASTQANWTVLPDTGHSEIDGSARRKASLLGSGSEGPEGQPRTAASILWVNCGGRQRTVMLTTDQPLDDGMIEVRAKLDSAPVMTVSAFRGRGILLFDERAPFLDSLSAHRRALIEYAPRLGGKTIAEFNLGGLDTMRRKLDTLCGS